MEIQTLQAVDLKKITHWHKLFTVFASDIKLSHSIFALPFVLTGLTFFPLDSIPAKKWLWIVSAMILARSFAMGMNRYLDREIDVKNDRTKMRAIPAGKVHPTHYLLITIAMGLGFIIQSFYFSTRVGLLSPLLLVILAGYSFMKHLSALTHWYLGICLGLAPVAAELALFDKVSWTSVAIGAAVSLWTAGFDLLYSLQDREFDGKEGLFSGPSRWGHQTSIWMSRMSFVGMLVCLSIAGVIAARGPFWFVGVVAVAVVLILEHWMIRDAMTTGTSKKINMAFFNLNALVSIAFAFFAVLDRYVQ